MSLQYAILGILTYSPMNGYYLGKVFDKSINNFWAASLSQIYRELGTLENKGHVISNVQQQDDRPDKKIYSITKAGETAFNEWLSNFPETFLLPKRDEFTLRIFFASKLDKAELIKQFERFIEERENFKKLMTEGKEVIVEIAKNLQKDIDKPFVETDKLYWSFIARRAIITNQALIDWAKECINKLEG